MLRVTLYSRPGCRLCQRAKRQLQAALPAASIREVDVDTDQQLQELYGLEIPVAVLGGRELFRHRFTSACLQQLPES